MTDFAEPTELADIALARSIAGGDEAAFDRLYGEHVARVHAVCLRMAGDGARARSLTQEAFVRAWQRIGSFRGDSRLSTWLHRIAVNVVIEDARSRKRWRERLVAPEHGTGRAAVGDDPALRVDLERAIARLPAGARRMLVLRDVEGHSYDEVAELTGVSIGTVKSQISRARRLVRDMLEA